jgi:methyltransferase (TIGR00027 family)
MGREDPGETVREPSFTAMWHAWMRDAHANADPSPVFADTRSVELVPQATRQDVVTLMSGFSAEAADALIFMAVIRHRLLADLLPHANERGARQLVILGAGLDTTVFALSPDWATSWRVFEVDHPATQEWKRRQITQLGWQVPENLVFAACDFETQQVLSALDAAGFALDRPAAVSLFGVILYLTADATKAPFRELASLASGSEVLMTYSPPPGGPDPAVEEVWAKSSPKVDETGESFIGHYTAARLERIVRDAGFRDVQHHDVDTLNATYFANRSDGLQLHTIEQILTATR